VLPAALHHMLFDITQRIAVAVNDAACFEKEQTTLGWASATPEQFYVN